MISLGTYKSADGAHQTDTVNLPLAKPGVASHHDFHPVAAGLGESLSPLIVPEERCCQAP